MVAAGYIDKNKEVEAATLIWPSRLQDTYEENSMCYPFPTFYEVNEALKSII